MKGKLVSIGRLKATVMALNLARATSFRRRNAKRHIRRGNHTLQPGLQIRRRSNGEIQTRHNRPVLNDELVQCQLSTLFHSSRRFFQIVFTSISLLPHSFFRVSMDSSVDEMDSSENDGSGCFGQERGQLLNPCLPADNDSALRRLLNSYRIMRDADMLMNSVYWIHALKANNARGIGADLYCK